MAKGNSARRNSAFDMTKPEFIRPQTRLEANRWLDKTTFGAASALTNIDASTKTNIVSIGTDEAVQLMASTYAQYLEDAFNADPTYSPTENITTPGTPYADYQFGNWEFGSPPTYAVSTPGTAALEGIHRWMITEGIYGNARARIKATYALSQMIVCRQATATVRDITAFGALLFDATKSTNTNSFKTMLKKVTYNPAMALWLTYLGNAKAAAATGARPDENYAREIMQLFAVGLDCLNMDGTRILDANGDPIPTYAADYVSEAAKFFTGLRRPIGAFDYIDHLVPEDRVHEIGQKAALAYPDGTQNILAAQPYYARCVDAFANDAGYVVTVVNANSFTVQASEYVGAGHSYAAGHFQGTTLGYSTSLNGPIIIAQTSERIVPGTTVTINRTAHGLNTGDRIWSKSNVEKSIDYFLEVLTNHPTCAPFVAKSMIKLLVTNNPTPQYVRRVAEKFVNNGNGVRGDLSAVFKAIFLDRECIVPYGKNPENHGRYTTLFDRYMRLANNLRNDCVHYCVSTSSGPPLAGPRWGSPNHTLSATNQAINSVYTAPRVKTEYCGIAPDRAYMYPLPLFSPSVFNFYRPGYVAPKTKLAELSLTSPELQITTAETQTLWTNIALAATNYGDLAYNLSESNFPANGWTNEAMDSRGCNYRNSGMNLSGGTQLTITSVATSGSATTGFVADVANLEHAISAGAEGWSVTVYHRRLGGYFTARSNRPNATGSASLTFALTSQTIIDRTDVSGGLAKAFNTSATLLQVGDVLDVPELFVVGFSGFPGRYAGTNWQPFMTLLHKAAATLPDTLAVSDAQLDVGITYLEELLMSSPISPQLRQLMKNAANKAITLPNRMLTSAPDTSFMNHYRYMVYSYAQIRIRRMLTVLLVSPEFCTQY